MTAYALAHLRSVDQNDEIVRYLQEIDDTLTPFGGEFLVHGRLPDVLEGPFPGFVVVIGFPDLASAHAWYASPDYQAILPLRLRNADSVAVIVDGTPAGYRADTYVPGLAS